MLGYFLTMAGQQALSKSTAVQDTGMRHALCLK